MVRRLVKKETARERVRVVRGFARSHQLVQGSGLGISELAAQAKQKPRTSRACEHATQPLEHEHSAAPYARRVHMLIGLQPATSALTFVKGAMLVAGHMAYVTWP